jgi:hypothetical protein
VPSKLTSADSALLVETKAVANTTVITSNAMQIQANAAGVTILTLSTQAGSLQPQIYMAGGSETDPNNMDENNWANLGTARAIVANTLDIVSFAHGLPPLRVVYTPSAQPHTTKVLAKSFGGST